MDTIFSPPKTRRPALPALSVVAGAVCLSGSATFVKLADVSAGTAAFLRCAIALVVLIPLAYAELRREGPLGGPLLGCAAAAGVFLGIDYVLWTASILDVGAAIATVLITVQVIAFPLLGKVFGGTPIAGRFLAAAPLMIAGIALASGALGHSAQVTNPVRGSIMGIAAGVAYSGFLYLNRVSGRRSPRHLVTPIAVASAAAAATAGVIGVSTGGISLSLDAASWGWMIALALLGQVAAWLFVSTGTARLLPNTAAALLTLQPVLAIGFGLVVLGETPTAAQLAGCVVVILAVWYANRTPRARAVDRKPEPQLSGHC
ncbi:DMT family transporter [Amycolatopsis sp. NPDC059021]|uniref:DMT family transporter n=1 Tax=Amycolatopsis sp. NPDC059021 TaxID=3346704 RepID=UPI00366E0F4A